MANMKKAVVSGKTVKTTTRSPLNPFKKDVKMVNERTTRKPVAKPTTTKAPVKMTPKPKVTKKPEKMTPQDAAMKKILEKKYGKIYD